MSFVIIVTGKSVDAGAQFVMVAFIIALIGALLLSCGSNTSKLNSSEYADAHKLASGMYDIALIAYFSLTTTSSPNAFSLPTTLGETIILRLSKSVSWSETWPVKSIAPVPVIVCSNVSASGSQLKAVAFIVTVLSLLSALGLFESTS